MSLELSGLSVAEIRKRLLHRKGSVPPPLLAKLQKDQRQGVRRIYQVLRKRCEKEKKEQRRVESMLRLEQVLWNSGIRHIAGVDEVGVGPLAGPVVAASVVFFPHTFIPGINDSKQVKPEGRQRLARTIRDKAAGVGIGVAEVEEIDQLNVYHAGILAMQRAVQNLPIDPDHLLVDARKIPGLGTPQTHFSKGDSVNFSIAAASILAKTYRDQLMIELDRTYPRYGFARHKGYCTRAHMEAIQKHGPSEIHRKSFTFIQELCGQYSNLFYLLRKKLAQLATADEAKAFEKEFRAVRSQLSPHERRKIALLLGRNWTRRLK